jgi:hypothetical protein
MCCFGRLLFQKNKGIYCVSRLIFDDAAYTVIRHQGTYTHICKYIQDTKASVGLGVGGTSWNEGGGDEGGPRKGDVHCICTSACALRVHTVISVIYSKFNSFMPF